MLKSFTGKIRPYLLCPLWEIPFGADQSVRVQDTVDDPSFHHIGTDDGCVDGVGVFAPGGLCHGLPRMAVIKTRRRREARYQ